MSIAEQKNNLRELMRSRRREWELSGSPQEASERIRSRIEALDEFKAARSVLLYSSIPGEVPTGEWLERWYPAKRLVLPRVSGESLDLREYGPGSMQAGYLGIMEPSEEAGLVSPGEIDLAIVPGVAFDSSGRRLGHGGGFYDRLLPLLDCPKVGVALEYRLVDEVPSDNHDAPVDKVIV